MSLLGAQSLEQVRPQLERLASQVLTGDPRRSLLSQGTYTQEIDLTSHQGHWVWLNARFNPTLDIDGDLSKLIAVYIGHYRKQRSAAANPDHR